MAINVSSKGDNHCSGSGGGTRMTMEMGRTITEVSRPLLPWLIVIYAKEDHRVHFKVH